jgi:hypothetical protein
MDTLVVAHYKENLEWLKSVDNSMNIVVYHKSKNDAGCWKGEVLPNVGREAHTYLHHIITHYDELTRDDNNKDKCTFFSQGSLTDHFKRPLQHIKMSLESARTHGISNIGCVELTDISSFRLRDYRDEHLTPSIIDGKEENFGEWFKRVLGDEGERIPDPLYCIWGACFAVLNSVIVKRPKDFYEKLLKECDYSSCPESAHFLERAWQYIFKF